MMTQFKLEPYLCKVDSSTFCTTGECTEGGGAVQHSRGCASKRNPVHDRGSICTKSRLQQTYTETALSHICCPHNCWIMNTERFFSMADWRKDTYITSARKCTRILHGCAIKEVSISHCEVNLSILDQILSYKMKKITLSSGLKYTSCTCYFLLGKNHYRWQQPFVWYMQYHILYVSKYASDH